MKFSIPRYKKGKTFWSTNKLLSSFRFGVCCVFILNTLQATTVTQNCTYIQNSGFPNELTDTNPVSFTVAKCSNGKVNFIISKHKRKH